MHDRCMTEKCATKDARALRHFSVLEPHDKTTRARASVTASTCCKPSRALFGVGHVMSDPGGPCDVRAPWRRRHGWSIAPRARATP
eukprot:3132218-Pyramimonas_sp.AAC.1